MTFKYGESVQIQALYGFHLVAVMGDVQNYARISKA
jgi:hypothetical protein